MRSAEKANRQYFRAAYRTGQHGWAVEEPSPYALKFFEQLARLVPGGRLLDIGCGEGRHSIAAARMGFEVTGVDFEPLALRRARRFTRAKKAPPITFRQADVFALPLPDSRFDVVVDYGCLHHQRTCDWRRYRASVLRVLKPRGFYVLSVFSPRFRLFQGSRRRWHIAYGAYRRYFTRQDLAAFLGRDFDILEMAEEQNKPGGFWHILARRRTKPD